MSGDVKLLTSADAAKYLGASPTSVKRWANEGRLQCVRTIGRHRRFTVEALNRFRRKYMQVEMDDAHDAVGRWLDDLLDDRPYRLRARFYDARDEFGSWAGVCDWVAVVLHRVGEAWTRGDISIIDEHLASERLARTLVHVLDSLPAPEKGPVLLITPSMEDHTLGLSLAELAFRELGYRCLWSGRRTPANEIGEFLEQNDVKMVAASATIAASANAPALHRYAEVLTMACRPRNVALVFGGRAPWLDPPTYGYRLRSFADLRQVVEQMEVGRRLSPLRQVVL